MTGLREPAAEAVRRSPAGAWLRLPGPTDLAPTAADAVLGVLGDPDTHALIQRVLAEHAFRSRGRIYDTCCCGWYGNGHAAHQAAAVMAALTEEQT